MGQVLIRNLDDRVIAALKRRAERNDRSLEHELRVVLTAAAGPTPEEQLSTVDRIRALTRGAQSDSTDLVREDRDAR